MEESTDHIQNGSASTALLYRVERAENKINLIIKIGSKKQASTLSSYLATYLEYLPTNLPMYSIVADVGAWFEIKRFLGEKGIHVEHFQGRWCCPGPPIRALIVACDSLESLGSIL